jgi:phenylalanyl-tRNA synthetase alpha chain
MGFEVVSGPEMESDYHNFEALNISKEHPTRDEQASFFVEEELILRTHTSPVQIRVMKSRKPPVRIIAPGKVYRVDPFDPSHSPVFHQLEGLYVDEGVSFAELKGTLEIFAKEFFGADTEIKFLPSYFPFTEPSAEVAISCAICKRKGCSTCGYTGWLEVLGCGMVHPRVFENVGYNTEKYTGYAFGFGIERMAMIKYRIPDIRLFYENEIDFLEIFK